MRSIAVLCLFALTASSQAADKSRPRSLDPELKIELFAEHPTIVTPTGLDVDHKGRVFAVESNTHFRPDNYKGHKTDRILVLQDTSGDGKADKTTVFADGLTHTMSVAVKPLWLEGRGSGKSRGSRVQGPATEKKSGPRQQGTNDKGLRTRDNTPPSLFIATRRDIWLYHDDDGDLKADRREHIIRLDTKGDYPHNGLAGFAFDAMGWMYFGFGENLGADYTIVGSDGVKLSGGGEGGNLYRCRPDGSKLSRWATGFWNPHASCVDAFGRLFTVDNDADSRPPCRLLHVIEGGDYGFRFRNGRKGLHPFTAWNGEVPGTLPMVSGTGEAPSGIVAYESDGLPAKSIGSLLVTSWGDHRIDRFVLQPKGASFVSRPETIIQGGEDFRPVGLATAPDGSLFCTDWVKRDYNLHGHGRVWRISRNQPGERRGVSPPRKRRVIDISTITPQRPVKELKQLLSHPRLEVRRMAARALAARHRAAGTEWDQFSLRLPGEARRRDFHEWACAWHIPRLARRLGVNPDERTSKLPFVPRNFRNSIVKAAGPFELRQLMHLLIVHNASTQALISEFRNAQPNQEFRIPAEIQLERIRLACLLGGRENAPRNVTLPKLALATKNIALLRVAVQWVAEENLKELKPQVAAVLDGKVMNADLFLATLASLEMLDGKSPQDFDKTPAAKYVLPLVKDAKRSPAVRAQALRLVDPDEKALDEKLFRDLLKSKNHPLQLEAIRTLQFSLKPFAVKLMAEIATSPSPWRSGPAERPFKELVRMHAEHRRLVLEAVLGLSNVLQGDPDNSTALAALSKLIRSSLEVRSEVFRSLRGVAPRNSKIRALMLDSASVRTGDPAMNANLTEHLHLALNGSKPDFTEFRWKKRPQTTADWMKFGTEKKTRFDEYHRQMSSNPVEAGRRVFFHPNGAGCYKCHTVNGRGRHIGPDLTYIARTMNRRKLAESILEPAKEIAPQFTLWSFATDDGKVHHGVILGDTRNGQSQQIGTPEGRIVELPLNRIELRTPQKKSAMPDKLIDRLTATEFRDLLAFLESLK